MDNTLRAGQTWPTFAREILRRRDSLTLGETVGLALREHRRRLGLSQRAYAAVRGLTKAMVARLECHAELFRIADLERVLEGTGYRLVLMHRPDGHDEAEALRPVEPGQWDRAELVARVRGGSRRFPGHRDTRQVSNPPPWWWQRESTVASSVPPNWYCPLGEDEVRPA